MMRTQVIKLTRANPLSVTRAFSAAAVRAAEGDIGAVRSGGAASSDSFNKREQASENQFIREREREALRRMKAKLAEQQKHLAELENHIKDLEKEQGGEHH